MVYFPNVHDTWNKICHPVSSMDGVSHQASSLKGRSICLIHVLATPLKAWAGLGKLVLTITYAAHIIFSVLTLNAPLKHLMYAGTYVIDAAAATILLPVALLANVIRGLVGAIFHPGVMIQDDSQNPKANVFAANHNILQGTLIHYTVLPEPNS